MKNNKLKKDDIKVLINDDQWEDMRAAIFIKLLEVKSRSDLENFFKGILMCCADSPKDIDRLRNVAGLKPQTKEEYEKLKEELNKRLN